MSFVDRAKSVSGVTDGCAPASLPFQDAVNVARGSTDRRRSISLITSRSRWPNENSRTREAFKFKVSHQTAQALTFGSRAAIRPIAKGEWWRKH